MINLENPFSRILATIFILHTVPCIWSKQLAFIPPLQGSNSCKKKTVTLELMHI